VTTSKAWCRGLTAAGLALVLAGCGSSDDGDDGDAGATAAPTEASTESTEPAGDSTDAEDEPDDPLLAALEALSPDFEGAKSCTAETPPEVFDVTDQKAVTAAEWFGELQPGEPGARPAAAYNADFCLPDDGEFGTSIELVVLEFDAEDDASTWLDDLGTATASGQPVRQDPPPEAGSCPAESPDVAIRAPEPVAGGDAVDVVVEEPCGPLAKFPELEWTHPTYSFAQGGCWVVVVYVERSGGGSTSMSDGQMTMELTRVRQVEPELQRAAVETLTEELADD